MGTDNRIWTVASRNDANIATVEPASQAIGHLVDLVERAEGYAAQAKAPNTRRAYQSDWSGFQAWCEESGLTALPACAGTVAAYLTYCADEGLRVSTMQRKLVAISQAHKTAGHPTPTSEPVVREVLKGIRRVKGCAQDRKAPVMPSQLRAIVDSIPEDLSGLRDRALLLVGFSGGFRRSELVGLDVADVEFTVDGMIVHLRRSKTDQDGEGRTVGVPYGSSPQTCPVRSLKAWMHTASITAGPLFREVDRWGHVAAGRMGGRSVALLVKRHVEAIGLDPRRFAGHSLRAGLATAAAKAGKSERAIMNQTGHRSVTMVRRYIREGSLFTENAAAGLL